MSGITFDEAVAWLRVHEGHTAYVEIGGSDPVRDDYDVRYALLHGVTLGQVSVTELDEHDVASVAITNLDDGARIAFERHRFVDAKIHAGTLYVNMMHVYIGISA